jgi:hypothetical protein
MPRQSTDDRLEGSTPSSKLERVGSWREPEEMHGQQFDFDASSAESGLCVLKGDSAERTEVNAKKIVECSSSITNGVYGLVLIKFRG